MNRTERTAQVMAGPRGRTFADHVTLDFWPRSDLERWRSVDQSALRNLRDPVDLLPAMIQTADDASYWGQDGYVTEVHSEQERQALSRIVESILASPAMDWWSEPFDPDAQRLVHNSRSWFDEPTPPASGSRERVESWRRDSPGWGAWWSAPLWRSVRSTRALGDLPATDLEVEEDSWDTVPSQVSAIVPTTILRVCEIDGTEDWSNLVTRYPLNVTDEKHREWGATTGVDSRWFMPDWLEISNDFDVVHLTGIGYLTTAGVPVEVDGGHALLAGFEPDLAFWLTDTYSFPEPAFHWDPPEE